MVFTAGYQMHARTRIALSKMGMIMKLMIPLLFFFVFQLNANGYAQRVTIVKKDLSLAEAFRSIERQTGFFFFYDNDMIQKSGTIDVLIRNATVEQALSECLKDTPFTYTIVSRTIVIQRSTDEPGTEQMTETA